MPDLDDWMKAKLEAMKRRLDDEIFSPAGSVAATTNETTAGDTLTLEKLDAAIRSLGVRWIVLVTTAAPADQLLLIKHDNLTDDSWPRIAFSDYSTRPDIMCSPAVWPHLRAHYNDMGATISEPTGGPLAQFYTVHVPRPKPRPHPGALTINWCA